MGGSWDGDTNNCWDNCFGKEESLANQLVAIVDAQNLDGIDIDYEYCYDKAGKQNGANQCQQTSVNYSDTLAKTFLDSLTSKLRTKLDALATQPATGRYELSHAPMDADLTIDSEYYKILKARNADLDFLMPQFYNGVTRAVTDGIEGTANGPSSAVSIYNNLVTDLFSNEPEKVSCTCDYSIVL